MIYIDNDFRCHISNPEGAYSSMETDFFDGKCQAYIEGYRFIPSGESGTRQDGEVFHGEMVSPWQDWQELDEAQQAYEREQYAAMAAELADAQAALEILGVNV